MKQDWKYTKLSDVCHITSGYTPKSNELLTNGDIPYYKVADMNTIGNEVYLDYTQLYKNTPCKTFAQGSIVFPKNGAAIATNKKRVLKHESIVDLNTAAATFTNEVNNIFGYYWFKNIDFKNFTRGGALPTLDIKTLKESTFPLPSLEEQTYIVSELNRINRLIEIKKSQLNDFEILSQSLFSEMFGDPVANNKGWEVKKLKDISCLICNGNTPKGGSEVYVDTGFLFLRSQNVWKNRIELDDVAYIDEATHKSLKKSSLKHNDLLITKTGRINTENSSLGRTALFVGEDNSANINGHVYLVRLKDGMVHKYVLYILISNSYRELIRKTCVGGIDKRQLNKDHIEDFPIIFPPIELQKKYVERVELIEKQKEQVSSTIKDLETLLASRMQYWFD